MQPNGAESRLRLFKPVIIVLGVLLVLAGIVAIYLWRFSPLNRKWAIRTLEKYYESDVEMKTFSASLFPSVSISGEGLVLRRRNQENLPPIVVVRKFSVNANWLGLLRHPRRFGQVRLEGLALVIPTGQSQPQTKKKRKVSPFVLDEVLADDARLSILPANTNKPPHVFEIHKLRMQSAGVGQPMSFQVTLTNPVPVGQIQSHGRFGPWNTDDPSLTPVSGSYTFSHADLSTIHGLGGTLSSQGSYDGILKQIRVHGETDTPDFDLGVSGNKLPLKTQFTAVVDGVNGNTHLQPVIAQLLGSTIVAHGEVIQAADKNGRIVLLAATVQSARLEDLLRLAVKSTTPPITGTVSINTKIDLHPGKEEIAKRLKLDGGFKVQSARFTNPETEGKITGLSRRGQGKPSDEDIRNARFDMQGHFGLGKSQVTFSSFSFSVPGATLRLQGSFGLLSQALDFEGTLRLRAKVSQTTTGIKSDLLKLIDPLFEREGAGTVLPIKITGTREAPSFQLEIGKILRRKN